MFDTLERQRLHSSLRNEGIYTATDFAVLLAYLMNERPDRGLECGNTAA